MESENFWVVIFWKAFGLFSNVSKHWRIVQGLATSYLSNTSFVLKFFIFSWFRQLITLIKVDIYLKQSKSICQDLHWNLCTSAYLSLSYQVLILQHWLNQVLGGKTQIEKCLYLLECLYSRLRAKFSWLQLNSTWDGVRICIKQRQWIELWVIIHISSAYHDCKSYVINVDLLGSWSTTLFHTEISQHIGWIAMKFYIHDPQRMKTGFGDLLTFLLAPLPPWRSHSKFLMKCLNNHWMDCCGSSNFSSRPRIFYLYEILFRIPAKLMAFPSASDELANVSMLTTWDSEYGKLYLLNRMLALSLWGCKTAILP